MCAFQAAKRKLEAARAEAGQLTGRLGEAEAEAKKHALLLQHIHVSAATDPSRLLTKCACRSLLMPNSYCLRQEAHWLFIRQGWIWYSVVCESYSAAVFTMYR